MEKNKSTICGVIGLMLFAVAALASSSAKELTKDPDFQRGYRIGYEAGQQLFGETETNTIESDSVSVHAMPDVAIND